jgi:hypothetical protein
VKESRRSGDRSCEQAEIPTTLGKGSSRTSPIGPVLLPPLGLWSHASPKRILSSSIGTCALHIQG